MDLKSKSTIRDKERAFHNNRALRYRKIEIIKGKQITPTITANFNTPYSATSRLNTKTKMSKDTD